MRSADTAMYAAKANGRSQSLFLGCDQGQGYHFSKPLNVQQVEQLFAQGQNAENGIVLASL